jgi:multidrug transporter EmrE-like cation transporter
MKYFAIWYALGILGCILIEVKHEDKSRRPFEAILLAMIICSLLGPIMLGTALAHEDKNG